MWSPERRALLGAALRLAAAGAAAGTLAACGFQPLYGERTADGRPGIRDALSSISIKQIDAPNGSPEARIAVELRNQLLFDLTGGGGTTSPTHELTILLKSDRSSVIVDPTSQRALVENFGIDVNYQLKELATGKTVVRSTAFTRVSYDTPGGEQRFVRARGLRDAEDRAAKLVADQIRNRLASYFVAGT
jgi:LPS-assembly lipoprotein